MTLEMEKPPQDNRSQIKLRATDRIVITGLPGSGKTTLAYFLGSFCTPNLMIIDPLNQYGQFDDVIPEGYRFVPQRNDIQDLEDICKRLNTVNNHVLLIEECEDYIFQGVSLPPYTYKVIRQGRNWGIGLIAVSQRIQEVDKKFVDRSQHLMLFKCGWTSFGYLKDALGKTRAQVVLNLKADQYEFVHYNIGEQSFRRYNLKRPKSGGKWTIESSESTTDESPSETHPSATPQSEVVPPPGLQALPEQTPGEQPPHQEAPQGDSEPRMIAQFRKPVP